MATFLLTVTLLTVICLHRTLSLGLTGDDWFALYRYIIDFPTFTAHFSLASYVNDHSTYNFADILMGLIYRYFSFNPFPYYFISMILRIIAAVSFYWAVSMATKDKLAGYLSSLLFSVMFIGIETTNWVFNMNTYLSITLFNLFIYLYTKKGHTSSLFKNAILGTILGLSFIITPNRMHGLLFAIPFIALLKLNRFTAYTIGQFFIRILLFYLPVFIFRMLVRSASDLSYTTIITKSLTKADFSYKLLVNLSNSFIPENAYKIFGISQGGQAVIAILVFLAFGVFFCRQQKVNPAISKFALLSLSFVLSFLVMPLLVFNPVIMPSDHRYFIIPGSYMMVVYASFFSIVLKGKKQFLLIPALLLIVLIFSFNFFSLIYYFNDITNKGRLAEDSKKQYTYLISQLNRPDNNAPVVLLFIPDDENYLYNAITFGLPYHMMLTDKRMGMDIQKAPFPVENLDSLIDVLSSENSSELKRYGHKPVKIPLENVFVFTLQNQALANVTPQARKELKNLIPSFQEVNN